MSTLFDAQSQSTSSNGNGSPPPHLPIGQYLIQRLQDYGVRDMFGLPGDYILSFYTDVTNSPIRVITCTREDCAGFAADAYARINGLSAVCVTYGVGGLSACNSIAGAYAEKSPVLLISGSPGLRERYNNPLLHHKVREFRTQYEVFQRICVAATDLLDPSMAYREIDRVLEAIVRFKRPGYIELPRDLVHTTPDFPYFPVRTEVTTDPDALRESVAEAVRRISSAAKPVIVAGVELHRFGLQNEVLALVEGANIPFVTTALGKSVISEQHPLYAGMYEGAMGRSDVTEFVEESDCIVLLGEFMTDINSGIYTAKLDPLKTVVATSETLQISHHHFRDVLLGDFIRGLAAAGLHTPPRTLPPKNDVGSKPYVVEADQPMSIRRLVARLNLSLDENTVVVADVGDALFSSMDLTVHRAAKFLSPAYYTSMGFAVPAALGVQIAQQHFRPIVLVGDGAFQMTGMELSTIVRHKLNPIVILLDNKGYGTERFLHEGEHDYNNVLPWNYAKIPEVLGGGRGYEVRTEGEFDAALKSALADKSQMSLIQVHIAVGDASITLQRLAERMKPTVEAR